MAETTLKAPSISVRSWFVQSVMYIGLLAGAWAFIFGRLAQQQGVPTTYLVAFRLVLAALILTPLVISRYSDDLRRLNRRGVLLSAAAGLWMVAHFTAIFSALEHTSVLVTSILVGTAPLWVALLEARVLRARLNRFIWLGLVVTFVGGCMIALSSQSGAGDNVLLGAALALAGAVAAACYTLIGRGVRERLAFLPYIWLMYTFAAIFASALVIITGTPLTGYQPEGYFHLIMLTLIPQLIGHSAHNYVLRHLSATYVSIVGQFGLVLAATLALVIFHEIPVPLQIAGAGVIIGGIVLVNIGQARHS